MILISYFSKDSSLSMGAFLGAVMIVLDLLFLLFSDIPKFMSSSSNENVISVDVEAPPKVNEN